MYFGAKAAMGLGRDLRGAIFTRVAEFSEQEVTRFGAPSLITRSTNDVQQVQQLVLMSATLMVAAPMLSIGGVDHGRPAGRASCPGSSPSACRCCCSASG